MGPRFFNRGNASYTTVDLYNFWAAFNRAAVQPIQSNRKLNGEKDWDSSRFKGRRENLATILLRP